MWARYGQRFLSRRRLGAHDFKRAANNRGAQDSARARKEVAVSRRLCEIAVSRLGDLELEGDTQRHRHVPRSDLSSGCRGGLQAKCGNVADVVSWTFRKTVASPLKWDVILYGKTTPCMVSQCQGLETSTRHSWCYNIIATSHHATSVVCVVTVFKL